MIAGSMMFAFLSPSFGEMILIAIIALLLYGSDLPQVARTWGKAYQEFRRHLNGIRSDLNDVIYAEEDSPRKLQYYPEFQHEASDEGEAETESKVAAAGELKSSEGEIAPASESDRQDAHGAA